MTITRHTSLADLPEFLRVEEAAIWLDVSEGVVYELCRQGRLRGVRLGRLLRIPKAALIAMADGTVMR